VIPRYKCTLICYTDIPSIYRNNPHQDIIQYSVSRALNYFMVSWQYSGESFLPSAVFISVRVSVHGSIRSIFCFAFAVVRFPPHSARLYVSYFTRSDKRSSEQAFSHPFRRWVPGCYSIAYHTTCLLETLEWLRALASIPSCSNPSTIFCKSLISVGRLWLGDESIHIK